MTKRLCLPTVSAVLALAAAGCAAGPAAAGRAPAGTGSTLIRPPATTAAVTRPAAPRALAATYLRIAEAGNRRLDRDFDGLEDHSRSDLAAAAADLRDAAATERLFDARLLRLAFPPATELFAHFLVWVNQARARLSLAAAHATSLRQLGRYQPRLAAANMPVEQAVTIIRVRLGLPPPDTS